jgi:hypothetical protein
MELVLVLDDGSSAIIPRMKLDFATVRIPPLQGSAFDAILPGATRAALTPGFYVEKQ